MKIVHGFRFGRLLVGVRAPVLALSAGDFSWSASSDVDASGGACGDKADEASPSFCSLSLSLLSRSTRSRSFRSFFSLFLNLSLSAFSFALAPFDFMFPFEGDASFGVSRPELDAGGGVELGDLALATCAGIGFSLWGAGVDRFVEGPTLL
jgi:hypothetical protein